MREIRLLLTLVFYSAGLTGLSAQAQILSPQFSPVEQLLVLKNGEVMRGRITQNGEQVILQTGQGSRLVLSADRTEFTCNTMEEAYWGKLARTKATDVDGQKRLFHWCLRQKLLSQAQNQIDILLQSKVKATELEYLDRQLNVALAQQQNSQQRARLAAKSDNEVHSTDARQRTSVSDKLELASANPILSDIHINQSIGVGASELNAIDDTIFRPLPSLMGNEPGSSAIEGAQLAETNWNDEQSGSNSAVRQVGFEEEVVFDTISLDHKIPTERSSVEMNQAETPVGDQVMIPVHELDRETRSMPPGSLRLYRQRVERVLANGCSAAQCHDGDSRVMPLLQLSRGQAIPRRQSQRNLHNVLKYVDKSNPFDSPLFHAAMRPHAGLPKPILKKGSTHHDNLMKWLIMMSDDPRESLHQAIQSERESMQGAPVAAETSAVEPIKPEPDPIMVPGESTSLAFPTTVGEIPKLDVIEQGFTPVDPFDPEIFNRKYGK